MSIQQSYHPQILSDQWEMTMAERMGVYVVAAMVSVGSVGISLSHATDSIHAEDSP